MRPGASFCTARLFFFFFNEINRGKCQTEGSLRFSLMAQRVPGAANKHAAIHTCVGGGGGDPRDPGVSWPYSTSVTGSRRAEDPTGQCSQVTVNREVAPRGCACVSERGSFAP